MSTENIEDLVYSIACTIIDVIDENRHLKKENKELQKRCDEQWQQIKYAYEGSQKVAGAWISALLNGDIKVNDK